MNDTDALVERLQEFVGRSDGPSSSAVVDPTVVTRLIEAIGDRNPVYSDPEAAKNSVHGRVVAPVTALMSWTVSAKPVARHGVDDQGRRVFRLEGAAAGSASVRSDEESDGTEVARWGAMHELGELLKGEGYVAPAVTNGSFEYHRYLEPGEVVTIEPQKVEKIVGPKKTGLGEGFFITSSQTVRDQAGESVGVVRFSMLRAKPFGEAASAEKSSPAKEAPSLGGGEPRDGWKFRNDPWAPSVADPVAVGEELPELIVDVTPSQIVAGALASQDWAPVHHDQSFATGLGHPGVIMNVQISTGFVGRFVTDWAGPDALIEALDLKLGVPCYPGDTLTISGKVESVEHLDGRDRVTVSVAARNSLGVHIGSTVTLTVPA